MHLVETPSTVSRISALAELIQAAIQVAGKLTVADEESRLELLDGLAVAQLNTLRLAEEP